MPLFKVWDISRTKKKSVMANTIEELKTKGCSKLELNDENCLIFDENDGTEVDDDECLMSYEKGSVFIIGKNFHPPSNTILESEKDKETDSNFEGILPSPAQKINEEMTLKTEANQIRSSLKRPLEEDQIDEDQVEPDKKQYVHKTEGEHRDDNESSTSQGTRNYRDAINQNPFMHAKMNNWKIYSESEISCATNELERKRRRFWNEKSEQLASKAKTSGLKKTVVAGIVDVSWTVRKTSLIEVDAKNILSQEKVLFEPDNSCKTTGPQKKETIPKNLDRMACAHMAVERNDAELQKSKERLDKAHLKHEKVRLTSEYNKKKNDFDGAYTELKRAQDAMVKSIKAKKQQMEKRLVMAKVKIEKD